MDPVNTGGRVINKVRRNIVEKSLRKYFESILRNRNSTLPENDPTFLEIYSSVLHTPTTQVKTTTDRYLDLFQSKRVGGKRLHISPDYYGDDGLK